MDPAAGLGFAFRDIAVDVGTHVGQKGDHVVVGHRFDRVDFLLVEGGMVANPGGLLAGDANLSHLGMGLAGEHLDFLPDCVFVLEREDVSHLGPGIAVDH